jgi:hypothetical protein
MYMESDFYHYGEPSFRHTHETGVSPVLTLRAVVWLTLFHCGTPLSDLAL